MSGLVSIFQFLGDLDWGHQGRLAEVFGDLAVIGVFDHWCGAVDVGECELRWQPYA
jgi:hypothetical protein